MAAAASTTSSARRCRWSGRGQVLTQLGELCGKRARCILCELQVSGLIEGDDRWPCGVEGSSSLIGDCEVRWSTTALGTAADEAAALELVDGSGKRLRANMELARDLRLRDPRVIGCARQHAELGRADPRGSGCPLEMTCGFTRSLLPPLVLLVRQRCAARITDSLHVPFD